MDSVPANELTAVNNGRLRKIIGNILNIFNLLILIDLLSWMSYSKSLDFLYRKYSGNEKIFQNLDFSFWKYWKDLWNLGGG
jgi:hypothetical protein